MVEKILSPDALLQKRASESPQGTRCVLAVDPDNLITWGKPTLQDRTGRIWKLVIHRGDDWISRVAWQNAWKTTQPILLVLTRSTEDPKKIIVTYIADLLSYAEGDIIDLSILSFFKSLFPKVNPPLETLVEYKNTFIENAAGVLKVYPQFKQRWGEPDYWSRGQFLTILLMARYPTIPLEEFWCDESDFYSFLTHALRLILHPELPEEENKLVQHVIEASTRQKDEESYRPWISVLPEEMAGYLVLRYFLSSKIKAHLGAILKAKVGFTSLDPEKLSPQIEIVTDLLKASDSWENIQHQAEDWLRGQRLHKALELIDLSPEAIGNMLPLKDTPTVFLHGLLRQFLFQWFVSKEIAEFGWVFSMTDHHLLRRLERDENLTALEVETGALLRCLINICLVAEKLTVKMPRFENPEDLLNWYTKNKIHLLELQTSEAYAKLEMVKDDELAKSGYLYLMGSENCLKNRVHSFLETLDSILSEFIRKDPQKFFYGPRSAHRIISKTLRKFKPEPKGRVWLLLMDGMRLDTWESIIKPIFLEHFEVVEGEDQNYFSILPSKTDVARRSLLAGGLGTDWKNYLGKPTREERILVAKALGISINDVNSRLCFVTDAETTKSRVQKMGFGDEHSCDYNILIYPISDDLHHFYSDTLASLNQKIKQTMKTQQGTRGIMDDLKYRIRPGDLVLVTSDHGFIELDPARAIEIKRAEAYNAKVSLEDTVAYRYIKGFYPKGKDLGSTIIVNWEESSEEKKKKTVFTLPVGRTWFRREGGQSATYSHGGVSLAEMIVPGVLLRPIVQRTSRVEYIDLPTMFEVREDEVCKFEFGIWNSGNTDSGFEIQGETNLGEKLKDLKGYLTANERHPIEVSFTPHYETGVDRQILREKTTTSLIFILKYNDSKGVLKEFPNSREIVHVTVKPKATKIDTDALKSFDDI